jgi:crossover junction endodeoxyribonuclease RuvC
MRVFGLDLSLTGTGISDGRETWVVGSKGTVNATLDQRQQRLGLLRSQIMSMMLAPDLVVVEAPAFSSSVGQVWDRAGLWWSVVTSLMATGVPVAEVPPTVLKKYATGVGNAGKPQMLEAAIRRFPGVVTMADDNRVDALWLAALGHDHNGQPLVLMPIGNREMLGKVRWP